MIPLTIDTTGLIAIRNELDDVIKQFETINLVTDSKKIKLRKIGVNDDLLNKILDILFEDTDL